MGKTLQNSAYSAKSEGETGAGGESQIKNATCTDTHVFSKVLKNLKRTKSKMELIYESQYPCTCYTRKYSKPHEKNPWNGRNA